MSLNRFEGYKATYRFNASHSIGGFEDKHTHTFKVNVYIQRDTAGFVEFSDYENEIKNYFEQYRRRYINSFKAFEGKPATLENMCKVFFEDVKKIFDGIDDYTLVKLEICDSPTKSVSVSEIIFAGDADTYISDECYKNYVEAVRHG